MESESKKVLLLKLKLEKPTKVWLDDYLDGRGGFSENLIIEAEWIFDEYFYNLISLKEQEASQIFEVVKTAYVRLNSINEKYNSFINTQEREEIITYLRKGAIVSGLDSNVDFDRIPELQRNW